MSSAKFIKLLGFLQEDLAISKDGIELALRNLQQNSRDLLPMLLWQYGLVNLSQLDQIFNYLNANI
ncbi:MAG: DUF2949 domain-containing protein [Richelia sp. RM2_1_2]|nr:DUF2949 domain-containing protein [Richelia sp. RM1_1_1]NJO26360.1 DUF2949 domain-containing protein [Richelia sp. SL_2_1]NJO57605.1 DUF2949 domain-containing protein [Richelia sp. RM2_1_2]